MSLLADALKGKQIHSAHVDSEVTYIMLTDGTQVTIKGVVMVVPGSTPNRKVTAPIRSHR